jgi:hypothetical protein
MLLDTVQLADHAAHVIARHLIVESGKSPSCPFAVQIRTHTNCPLRLASMTI